MMNPLLKAQKYVIDFAIQILILETGKYQKLQVDRLLLSNLITKIHMVSICLLFSMFTFKFY